jgi:cytochrome b subunit of formate dehydrogenase
MAKLRDRATTCICVLWGHIYIISIYIYIFIEGSFEVKLPTIWTDEKQSREEAERRVRLVERRIEEKE